MNPINTQQIDREKLKDELRKFLYSSSVDGKINVIRKFTADIELPPGLYNLATLLKSFFMMMYVNESEVFEQVLTAEDTRLEDFSDDYYGSIEQVASKNRDGKVVMNRFLKAFSYLNKEITEKVKNKEYVDAGKRTIGIRIPGEIACYFATMSPVFILQLQTLAATNPAIQSDLKTIEALSENPKFDESGNINLTLNNPISAIPFLLSFIVNQYAAKAREEGKLEPVDVQETISQIDKMTV